MGDISVAASPGRTEAREGSQESGTDEEVVAGERPLLIRLDAGFIARIEAERDVLTGGTGHKLPRTAMIRMLLKEALDHRARARGERVPAALAMGISPVAT